MKWQRTILNVQKYMVLPFDKFNLINTLYITIYNDKIEDNNTKKSEHLYNKWYSYVIQD